MVFLQEDHHTVLQHQTLRLLGLEGSEGRLLDLAVVVNLGHDRTSQRQCGGGQPDDARELK